MFHRLRRRELENSFDITVGTFRRYLEAIDEARVASGAVDVMITFDDGNASDIELALSELVSSKKTASFFIVPSLVGSKGYMTWDDVVTLRMHGMVVGSHTLSHRNLALCDPRTIASELTESRAMIQTVTGVSVDALALPGGFAPRGIGRYAKEAGYSCVLTSRPGYWDRRSLLVPRVCARPTLTPTELRAVLTGTGSAYLRYEQVKYMARSAMGPRAFSMVYDVWCRWRDRVIG